MRLDRFLSNGGFGSRSLVSELIKEGRVQVNGRVVRDPSFHVDPKKDVVEVNGERVTYRQHVYYMFNKPAGYVCSTHDPKNETIMIFFEENPYKRKLFPVGRLDKDVEGLLIITTDGELAHRLSHPKWEVPKEYYAVVKCDANKLDTNVGKEGLQIGTLKTKPFEIRVLSDKEVIIRVVEGKYHLVKRILAHLSCPVVYLKRIRIGELTLDEDLKPGQYRELTDEELARLRSMVGLQ
ncbi:pseudouridine synthase [Thermocrinis minervae]|uniref:16S rRNA pseudouridine516 synthase n=1 Tax=Thermocrinis minervae TaxID=381751 RepID=A0A1M6SDJ2_9AQUI|nr:pseudouridine synthase [Thermocrinis minervae]SHK42568.1 16S rRNA pseudouridine516 synthase [Thermocrinis minervae]